MMGNLLLKLFRIRIFDKASVDYDNLEGSIINFFRNTSIEGDINLDTVINLDIDSDEGWYMMNYFFNMFEIPIGKDLIEIDKYFKTYIPFWKRGIKKKKKEEIYPITIRHMVEIVKRKEWFDPNN